MSDRISPIPLLDRHAGKLVEAILIDGITESQLEDVESHWWPVLWDALRRFQAAGKPRREWPQSRHWNWRDKVESIQGILAYRGFALECEERTQGLMLVKVTEVCRLPDQKGKPLVYVDYLETAPWNQRELVDQPRFGGIGTILLAAAITLSLEEGFFGRIGLHSLPQSEKFYHNSGVTDLGPDASKQGLRYFEMTAEQATAYLSHGKEIP
jgi:hypothetical protein